MLKVIGYFILIILMNSCKSIYVNTDKQEIRITKIDSMILDDYYYINFLDSKNNKSILISKKCPYYCEISLRENEVYKLPIQLLNTIKAVSSTTYRLNQNDIYIDGKLIFPRKIKVYKSNGITGICIK